jgi:mono/diheme cytochrome c family protein
MSAGRRVAVALLPVLAVAAAASAAEPQFADGAALFGSNCAVCHGSAGGGTPGLAPPLLVNPARYASSAEGRRQLAMTVLYGMFGDVVVDQKHYNFKMPEFSQLDDLKLAAALNFVVFDLAHAPRDIKPIGADELAAERNKGLDGSAVREHRTSVLEALGGS